jgi:hypothetical protein
MPFLPCSALQFLPCSPEFARDASDGSGDCRSRLGLGRNCWLIALIFVVDIIVSAWLSFVVRPLDTVKRKKRQPDAAAGGLAVAMGVGCFAIALFSSLSSGQRCGAATSGCLALSWGLKEVAAAKKWKQEPEDEHYATSAKDILESEREEKMEKSGSMHNVLVLLVWIFLFLAVVGAVGVGYLFGTRP